MFEICPEVENNLPIQVYDFLCIDLYRVVGRMILEWEHEEIKKEKRHEGE